MPPDLPARIAADEHPRVEYLELARQIGAEVLDLGAALASRHPMVRVATARLGAAYGLAMLGFLRRHEVSQIYATGEDVGLPLGALMALARDHGRITMVVHNAGTSKRRAAFRLLGHAPYRGLICLGSMQREVLLRDCRLPERKVHRLHNWLDHRFYAPAGLPDGQGEFVLSVGMENRDYPTLLEAGRGLPIPFHVVGSGFSSNNGFAPASGLRQQEGFSFGSAYSFATLRDCYRRARLIVVPLNPVTYAAGVTAALEGFAMGKAVVATASPGLSDYVKDRVTGSVVPARDPAALRAAIQDLWEHPEALARMGARNRGWIESEANTDTYVAAVAHLMT